MESANEPAIGRLVYLPREIAECRRRRFAKLVKGSFPLGKVRILYFSGLAAFISP